MILNIKKIFLFLILIAVILSIIVGVQRFKLESGFKQVQTTMSLNKIRELAIKEGYDEDNLLEELKAKGISSIAIHEDNIETLSLEGRVVFLNTADLTKLNWIYGIDFFEGYHFSPGECLIICQDNSLLYRMKIFFENYYGSAQVHEYIFAGEKYGLKVEGNEEELVKLGLGFSSMDIEKVKNLGFDIVLRPKNLPKITSDIIRMKFSELSEVEDISVVIFDEEEALGYPSAEMLDLTAQLLNNKQQKFGVIEFASQKGIHQIASRASELAIKVHSITKEEMETITFKKAIDRWIRGARERNIRLFYINPFFNNRYGDLININLDYVNKINKELNNNGFLVGNASIFPKYQVSIYIIFVMGIGVLAAAILLFSEFIYADNKVLLLLFFIGILAIFLIYMVSNKIFLLKMLALGCAVTFPVLAIIKNKEYFLQKEILKNISYKAAKEGGNTYLKMITGVFVTLTRVMFISLTGGLIIGALLTHYQFILSIQLFSGIKISYILPLFLVILYLWRVGQREKVNLITDLKKPILFEHAFLVFIFFIFVVIYISRSGNFSFLPVPDIEEKMRNFLESLLLARPRSKEFLIGYPLLSLAVAMNYLKINFLKYPIIVMGTVASVTIVNTFCHAHTSLYFSLLRTFHGYWLGVLIGILLVSILYLATTYYRKRINGSRP